MDVSLASKIRNIQSNRKLKFLYFPFYPINQQNENLRANINNAWSLTSWGLQSININNRRLYLFYPQMLCVRNLELKVKLMYSFSEVLEFLFLQLHPVTWSYHQSAVPFTLPQLFTLLSFCLSGSFLSFIHSG